MVLYASEHPEIPFSVGHCRLSNHSRGPTEGFLIGGFRHPEIIPFITQYRRNHLPVDVMRVEGRILHLRPTSTTGEPPRHSFSLHGTDLPLDGSSGHAAAANLTLKIYDSELLLHAYRESMVYDALKPYQGNLIPYCYGMFQVNSNRRGVALLLERVVGVCLEEYLHSHCDQESTDIYGHYLRCRQVLALFHANGFAYRGEYGCHFIIAGDSLVLVGFDQVV